MQNYTYHSHTNTLGIYDGNNSAEEMIRQAEEKGFSEIGITNHLICHPNICKIDKYASMYFRDYRIVKDIYKKTIEEIKTASLKSKIRVLIGFEVDFFQDKEWRNFFEKLIPDLEADYYIGSSHFIYNNDYSKIYKISCLKKYPDMFDEDTREIYLHKHWENIKACAESGYFKFIAHLDQIKSKGFCQGKEWDEEKFKVIEALAKSKTGFELNTKGLRFCTEMYPSPWIVKELNKRNVPVVISDDAHHINQIGENFDVAESLLQKMNYNNRIHL